MRLQREGIEAEWPEHRGRIQMGVEICHTHLQGCSQPAPAGASGLGLSIQDQLMASRQVGVGGPQ